MDVKQKIKLLAAGGILVLVGVVVFLLIVLLSPASLEVTVIDEIAGTAVWDSVISFQDRSINGHFDKKFKFTDIKTGDFELVVTAPNYAERRVSVTIVPGPNVVEEPVTLKGLLIPDFYYFHIEEKTDAQGVGMLFHPITDEGELIQYYPGMDLVTAIRISEQWKNGAPVTEPTATGSERGPELFSGTVSWTPIDVSGAAFKYYAEIEPTAIKYTDARYYVVDCFILIPDPEKINSTAANQIIDGISGINDPKELGAFMAEYEDKVKYSYRALWNVKNVSERSFAEKDSKGGKQ